MREGSPGQGVLSGYLLHLADIHLTLRHRSPQLVLGECQGDSRNIHLPHPTQEMLQMYSI